MGPLSTDEKGSSGLIPLVFPDNNPTNVTPIPLGCHQVMTPTKSGHIWILPTHGEHISTNPTQTLTNKQSRYRPKVLPGLFQHTATTCQTASTQTTIQKSNASYYKHYLLTYSVNSQSNENLLHSPFPWAHTASRTTAASSFRRLTPSRRWQWP